MSTKNTKDSFTVEIKECDRMELAYLVEQANDAAAGDSNDSEIEALREAMEYAVSLLDLDENAHRRATHDQ